MKTTFKLALLSSAAALVTALSAGSAQATNGYFSSGYGIASQGMAGAGGAMSLDTQAAANNPAGMYALGNRVDLSISFFAPYRDTITNGGNFIKSQAAGDKTKSRSTLFLIPAMGVNFDRGDYTFGVTLTANGGMNTDYPKTIFQNGALSTSGRTGIDLAQALIGFTYARKFGENNTFGITPTIAAQRFSAEGLEGFKKISVHPTKLTGNGFDYSYGYGFRLGWQGKLTDAVTLGASYQSRMYMTKLKKYAGLFADGGAFDIPPAATLSVAFKATKKLTVAMDVQEIFYSDVPSIANSNNVKVSIMGGPGQLGSRGGMGFGWRDLTTVKLGMQYQYSPTLTLRAGVSQNNGQIPTSETLFNVLAPGIIKTHASVGATYKMNAKNELSFAFTRAFSASVNGVNTPNAVNNIHLRMDQYNATVGWSYLF